MYELYYQSHDRSIFIIIMLASSFNQWTNKEVVKTIEIFSVAFSLFHYDGCSHLCGNDSRHQPSPSDI